MALTANQRQVIVTDLATNCECWKGDEETLNGFTDEKLSKIKAAFDREQKALQVANAAVEGFEADGTEFRLNPETGDWEKRPTENRGRKMMEDEEEMMDDEEEDEDVQYRKKTNSKRMTGNRKSRDDVEDTPAPRRQKAQTFEDFIHNAPPEFQSRLYQNFQIEQQEKDKIITQLLQNVSPTDRNVHAERLQRRSLEELRNDLAIMPKVLPPSVEKEEATPRRSPATNRRRQVDDTDGDMLRLPGWQPVENEGKSDEDEYQDRGASDEDSLVLTNEDDWLKSAPAHVQADYREAIAIRERERRRLIEEITANVRDEDAQTRLVHRLQNKRLEELRDLAALAPRSDGSRSTTLFAPINPLPPAANQVRTTDVNEDVLPLPTMNSAEDDDEVRGRLRKRG